MQALDRYLRERRRHPTLSCRSYGWVTVVDQADGVKAMVDRRAALVGIRLHPHVLGVGVPAASGSEGDLMALGGWRSRTMLDRHGSVVAADRARDAYGPCRWLSTAA
jgi:hypothetical protein